MRDGHRKEAEELCVLSLAELSDRLWQTLPRPPPEIPDKTRSPEVVGKVERRGGGRRERTRF